MTPRACLLAGACLLAAASLAPHAQGQEPPAAGWQTFDGSWAASGQRAVLPTESGQAAAIVQVSGSVVLGTGAGLGPGFLGEIIGFDDGRGRGVGRFVWTDDRGDRIFGELAGDLNRIARRMTGTITGGSGRYAGIAGDFELAWQYVVAAEAGSIQVRAAGLKGRYRRGAVPR